jgi:hypothetical protein
MSTVRGSRLALFAVLSGCVCLGCESAHYVVREPDRGIVAIPHDSPELRAKAEELMHEQFPGGYIVDDVRVVPLGRPYHTVTQVGPFAEVETHQRHEVMFYYHAGQPVPSMPVRIATPVIAAPLGPPVTPAIQPACVATPPTTPDGLPPQPIPVAR